MPEPRRDPEYRRMELYLRSLERLGIHLGLDNITRLLEAIGNPHRRFPAVLVAGTNGKGSVAAILAAILSRAGIRTGLYTSPHLLSLEERIAVDGRPIPADRLAAGVLSLRDTIHSLLQSGALHTAPTLFEVTTAAAFAHFRAEDVQLAVLEVGMGGRFDATNVADPVLSILTPVALDHQEFLGNTLADIAAEKLGILRPGGVLLTGSQPPEAREVIRRTCHDLGAAWVEAAQAVRVVRCPTGTVSFLGRRIEVPPLVPGLAGEHQLDNAATAVAACEILSGRGFTIPPEAVRDGIAGVRWPGRLQLLPGRPRWLLDGAHNPAAARVLAVYLRQRDEDPSPVTIFGALRDKDHESMLQILAPYCRSLILCPPPSDRAADRGSLEQSARRVGLDFRWADGFREAAAAATRHAGAGGTVLVTGSLYLVGEALRWKRFGKEPRRRVAGRMKRALRPASP